MGDGTAPRGGHPGSHRRGEPPALEGRSRPQCLTDCASRGSGREEEESLVGGAVGLVNESGRWIQLFHEAAEQDEAEDAEACHRGGGE